MHFFRLMHLTSWTHNTNTHPIDWATCDFTGTPAFPTFLHSGVKFTRAPMSFHPAVARWLWTRLHLSCAGTCQTLWTCHYFNATSPFAIACINAWKYWVFCGSLPREPPTGYPKPVSRKRLDKQDFHGNQQIQHVNFSTELCTMLSKLNSINILVYV
jgi:hypothetical protein